MPNFQVKHFQICPRCNIRMIQQDEKLIEKWVCGQCKGIIFPWFEGNYD